MNVYSLHPGIVHTELGRTMGQVFFPGIMYLARVFLYPWYKTPEQGAQTTLYCSIDEKAGEQTGLHYRYSVYVPNLLGKLTIYLQLEFGEHR